HCWNVVPDHGEPIDPELFDASQEFGFYSLIYLAQAFEGRNLTEAIRITVVSNNLQQLTGSERICPERATLLGACKVIQQASSNLMCRQVDLRLSESGTVQSALLDQLMAEFCGAASDISVAYRSGHRWAQRVESIALEKLSDRTSRFRTGGVYLITGGLGTIGLALAEQLAQAAQARLALVGRSAFPGRERWNEWLVTHNNEDEISRKIQKLKALEELGAEVLIVSADVADESQMSEAVARILNRFGEIHGVIHAAGNIA